MHFFIIPTDPYLPAATDKPSNAAITRGSSIQIQTVFLAKRLIIHTKLRSMKFR